MEIPMTASPAPTRFSRPRFALLVLLGAYPLITSLLYIVFPLTEGWTIWQRTLVIVPLMVTAMVWGLIPGVQKLFRSFINPASR
jgi:antibiotic biosynthesis monooxygenase (ABM) superfamily enzyme